MAASLFNGNTRATKIWNLKLSDPHELGAYSNMIIIRVIYQITSLSHIERRKTLYLIVNYTQKHSTIYRQLITPGLISKISRERNSPPEAEKFRRPHLKSIVPEPSFASHSTVIN